MVRILVQGAIVVCGLTAALPAAAQSVAGPPGSTGGLLGGHRPVDPNRVTHRLSANFDLSAGYDSRADVDGLATVTDQPFGALYIGLAQSGIRYWRGRTSRFVEASARGRANYESTTRLQSYGGEAQLRASTSLGRRTTVAGGASFSRDPATLVAQFGPAPGEAIEGSGLDHDPPGGVTQQQWYAGVLYADLSRNWSTRHATELDVQTSRREPTEGPGVFSQANQASVSHSWNVRQNVAFRGAYRLTENRQSLPLVAMPPLRTSNIDVGLRVQRRFSPIRVLTIEVAGGAAQAQRTVSEQSAEVDYVLPVVSGAVRFNLTGTWALSVDGARAINVLEGITPEPFATQAGTLQLNATLSDRMSFAIAAVYSRGSGRATNAGAFETAEAQGQLQYGFGRCCGMFTSYSFYTHHVRDVTNLPPDFPERYRRHVARVGVTLWLPLYGSF